MTEQSIVTAKRFRQIACGKAAYFFKCNRLYCQIYSFNLIKLTLFNFGPFSRITESQLIFST